IMYLFRSKSQEVWIGTFGGGLNKVLNKPEQFETDLKFKAFTKDQGLPNDIILSITEESNENLWMTTENGIAMLDVRTKEFRNYRAYYGFLSSDISEAACLQLGKGEIIFRSLECYICFFPEMIVK